MDKLAACRVGQEEHSLEEKKQGLARDSLPDAHCRIDRHGEAVGDDYNFICGS